MSDTQTDKSQQPQAQLDEYREQFLAVQRFQAGDSEAALLLLSDFAEFLEGFLLLLRGQAVKRLTYSHRLFISNFVKNSGFARALRGKRAFPAALAAGETSMISVSSQLKPIDDDDLRQEISEIFLGTLRRYRSRNNENYLIPYILKSFPYALTRRVQQLVKDPLVNLQSDKIESIDLYTNMKSIDTERESNSQSSRFNWLLNRSNYNFRQLTTSYEENVAQIDSDSLGHAWLQGETCHDAFDSLTYIERVIVKSFYFLEMTDQQIADQLGISYNTAIRRRHHIESKIRGEYQRPECKWCRREIPKSALGRQPRQCTECRRIRRVKRGMFKQP